MLRFLVLALVAAESPNAASASEEGSPRAAFELALADAPDAAAKFEVFGFSVTPETVQEFVADGATKVAELTGLTDALSAGKELEEVLEIFKQGQAMLLRGVDLASSAWASFSTFATELLGIFTDFEPLKPIFESSTGLVSLITSEEHLQKLIGVVQRVLGMSGVLGSLSGACDAVMKVFGQLEGVFSSALSKLEALGLGRRLALDKYTSLLEGIDLESIKKAMTTFITKIAEYSKTLGEIDTALGPMLEKLKGTGRRLGMAEDQKKYEAAIKKVVPTWQSVETLGIDMCPQVEGAEETATSLQCRIDSFILQNGVLSQLGGVVGSGGACEVKARRRLQSGCPKECLSCGVKDMLGENAGLLSYALVAFGAVGAVGAGAAAYWKKAKAAVGVGGYKEMELGEEETGSLLDEEADEEVLEAAAEDDAGEED